MPPRQSKSKNQARTKLAAANSSERPAQTPHTFFPFARYVSIVGVHTSLLAVVALFMPRVPTSVINSVSASPRGFMDPLTDDPKLTLTWILVGLVALQGWWAGWVRQWSNEYSINGTDTEKMLERNEQDKGKFTVRPYASMYPCVLTRLQKVKNAWLVTLASTFAIHTIIVLFGAPVLRSVFLLG